jgi:predicted transcriptional regulator
METDDVLSHKVANFVEKTLAGSFTPLVAHFLASSDLSREEIDQLKALAAKLERKSGESV